jgi:hypothetical protein
MTGSRSITISGLSEAVGQPLRISVAMATCNGAPFIRAQLASIAAQTKRPDELVINDDVSTDATVVVIEEFAQSAPFRVRVERNPRRLGVSGNFAAAIRRCDGDVVFLSDQDDVWHPTKLERVAAQFVRAKSPWMVTHDAAIVDVDGQPSGLTLGSQIRAAGRRPDQSIVAGCCMAMNRTLADFFQPTPQTATHDAWIALIADQLGLRLHLDEPLIDYRRHGRNVSQSFMSRQRRSNAWLRWRERLRRSTAASMVVQLSAAIEASKASVAALSSHRQAIVCAVGEERYRSVVERFARSMERDGRRLEFHQRRGTARAGLLRRNWQAGDYSGRDGVLSLIRDLAEAVVPTHASS